MCNCDTPYVFSALREAPARTCGDAVRADCSPYGRLYVNIQPYEDCACPMQALKNGSYFNELNMPYCGEDSPAACPQGNPCGGQSNE